MNCLREFYLLLSLFFLLIKTAAGEPNYELSFLLIRSSDGEVLAEQQADKLRIPASTLKVVTAAAALEQLGGERVFETRVLAQEPLGGKRLAGELFLQGEADPELTRADLDALARELARSGLRVVEGDLVVDPGPYSFPPYGPGWAWDDAGSDYSPEITGVSVDGGLIAVDPASPPTWIHSGDYPGVLLVPGREGAQVGEEPPRELAAPRMALRAGEMFEESLARWGISVRGEVREGAARGNALAVHRSRPLNEILKKALAESDNLAMELLFRASGGKLPTTLQEAGLRVVDGSGLSRYNLISARQLVSLLRDRNDLKSLLVRPGEGTMEKRFVDGWAAHNVWAKTGTMSNVSALTGFLFPDSPDECAFAIIINGHLDSTRGRKQIENELVESWAREIRFPYVLSD